MTQSAALDNAPVIIRSALPDSVVAQCVAQVLATESDVTDAYRYWERTDHGTVRLCRVERFTEAYSCARSILALASRLAEEAFGGGAILMKDKLNIKWPGGGGYRCHQDSQAYPPDLAPVITVGLALTPSDPDRGGLYVASGVHDLLPTDDRGCVTEAAQAHLHFECPALAAGDAMLFSGYVPHYSGANTTSQPRILALLTFVPHRDPMRTTGDIRNEYYRWRQAVLAGRGSTRLSTIDDFSGNLLDSPDLR